MRARLLALAGTAVLACSAQTSAELTERVLRFAHTPDNGFQEVATVVRSTAEIREAKVDAANRTLTLRATPAQIGLAEWLFAQLDQPATQVPGSATYEYRAEGVDDTAVRVFRLGNAPTSLQFMEIGTVVRSLAEIRRAFMVHAANAIVLRATPEQAAMAEWLIPELDKPVDPAGAAPSPVYRMGNSDDVARVFYLADAADVQQFYRRSAQIRTAVGLRRGFTYTARKALAVRGTSEQLAQVERLLSPPSAP